MILRIKNSTTFKSSFEHGGVKYDVSVEDGITNVPDALGELLKKVWGAEEVAIITESQKKVIDSIVENEAINEPKDEVKEEKISRTSKKNKDEVK